VPAMWMTALPLLLSCAGSPATDSPRRDPRPIEARGEPAKTVVVIVVDTVSRRMLGPWQKEWDTTPNLDGFYADSTVLADTQSVRGLTSVAVSSISSGVYPRIHGVRNNRDWGSPRTPILSEMFQDAGYTTLGYASNTCQFIDRGIDERVCTWDVEDSDGYTGQAERDQALVTQLSASLQAHPSDEKLFVWLHLINPHDPFIAVQQWYDEFHPDTYTGELEPDNSQQLDQWTIQQHPLTDEDLREIDAVYASQLRETDRQLGDLFAALQDAGRWDDSVVMVTADHGEELGEHDSYFFHGCSAYQPVMQVTTAIRAPGRLPQGQWIDTPVSATDLAPTVADLAGIGWVDYRDGETLVDELDAGSLAERPAYFERALATAGVVSDGHRYILDLNSGFDECKPYDLAGGSFPGDYEELYDHASDSEEYLNLAEQQPEELDKLRKLTCEWVTSDVWISQDADRTAPMVATCKDVLGISADTGGDGGDGGGGCSTVGGLGGALAALLGALLGLSRRR